MALTDQEDVPKPSFDPPAHSHDVPEGAQRTFTPEGWGEVKVLAHAMGTWVFGPMGP